MTTFDITGEHLQLSEIVRMLEPTANLHLTDGCKSRITTARKFLEDVTQGNGKTYYGVNTGFGSLYNVRIAPEEMERLQKNLVRSHAAGAGPVVPYGIARLTLLLKIISLARGYSGVTPELIDRLVRLYNDGMAPVMYQFGSLGASGDLAPLAHLALTIIGEGALIHRQGDIVDAEAFHASEDIQPLRLKSKEGLALINGTQFSAAYALWAVLQGERLYDLANLCAALSVDAFDCNQEPFDSRIHAIRPHDGQQKTAERIRHLLAGSGIFAHGEKQLQDPYAFRCIPQVHGASLDAISHCRQILEIEVNAVTDNPLVFADSGDILSGGNFHGQPIALTMDYLALALAELGNIAERRTYQLLSGHRGLPDYLTGNAGLESGLMIAQYTAASLVNRNKMLCSPVSIDSIPSSKGQEDHVSMSANAASKLYELCENMHTILAIEFLVAVRALEFRRPRESSAFVQDLLQKYRNVVPLQTSDHVLSEVIRETSAFLSTAPLYPED